MDKTTVKKIAVSKTGPMTTEINSNKNSFVILLTKGLSNEEEKTFEKRTLDVSFTIKKINVQTDQKNITF